MESEAEIRAEIRRLITEGNIKSHAPVEPNALLNQPKRLLTREEVEQKTQEEQQQAQTSVTHLKKVLPTPYADLLAYQEALPDLIEQRVQAAYAIRDMVLALPDRVRKEIMMAGGLYRPSKREKVWWRLQDDLYNIQSRVLRFLR